MRYLLCIVALMLSACATEGTGGSGMLVETTSANQVMAGASCTASNIGGSWNFVTPATINVGAASGDLHIVCNKPGYRTSEFVFRPMTTTGSSLGLGLGGGSGRVGAGVGFSIPIGGSGGAYPPRVTIEMTPL